MNHGISHKLKVNFKIHQLLFFRENWNCGEESTSLPFHWCPTGLWCQPPSSSLSLPHLWVPSFSLFLCWWLRVLCVFSIRWFDSVIMLHSLSHNHPCFDKRTSSSQSLKTEVIIFPSIYITSTWSEHQKSFPQIYCRICNFNTPERTSNCKFFRS